jgi:Protein of unknown function (DUF3093)
VSQAASSRTERLSAPWYLWAIATVIVGTLGLAVGYPLGWPAGVAAAAVAEGIVAWVLVTAAATVAVEPDALVAGRARLDYGSMGAVTPLDAPAASLLRGREADSRAYLLLRPWVQTAVRVDVDDVEDPAPYWYVSTRHPADLATAVQAARDAARRAGRDRRDDVEPVDEAG